MPAPNRSHFAGFIVHEDGHAVVVCSGEIDMAVAGSFRALLDQAIKASPRIVVEMRNVTFLDSSGLRVLAVAHVHARQSISVRNTSPAVTRVLELSRIDRFVDVQPAAMNADHGERHHVSR